MVNGSLHSGFCPQYFRFERDQAGTEFFDRQRIKILPPERGQWIIGLFRKEFIRVHDVKVDRTRALVNNGNAIRSQGASNVA